VSPVRFPSAAVTPFGFANVDVSLPQHSRADGRTVLKHTRSWTVCSQMGGTTHDSTLNWAWWTTDFVVYSWTPPTPGDWTLHHPTYVSIYSPRWSIPRCWVGRTLTYVAHGRGGYARSHADPRHTAAPPPVQTPRAFRATHDSHHTCCRPTTMPWLRTLFRRFSYYHTAYDWFVFRGFWIAPPHRW